MTPTPGLHIPSDAARVTLAYVLPPDPDFPGAPDDSGLSPDGGQAQPVPKPGRFFDSDNRRYRDQLGRIQCFNPEDKQFFTISFLAFTGEIIVDCVRIHWNIKKSLKIDAFLEIVRLGAPSAACAIEWLKLLVDALSTLGKSTFGWIVDPDPTLRVLAGGGKDATFAPLN